MGDFVNWSESADERRRLWGVLIFLFLGALAGGLLLVHAPLYAPVLPLVATVLVVGTAAIAFHRIPNTSNEGALITSLVGTKNPTHAQ